jgi:Na+-transporting methylmalonyl-CoA/oxaloacetate decarboxylase gamma subunit
MIFPLLIWAKIDNSIIDSIQIDDTTTLQQLSSEIQIPVKKLKECLGLENQIQNHATLQELKIGKKEVAEAINEYNEKRLGYYWSIVILGMAIVFLSLVITAFCINLLQHVTSTTGKKKKSPKKKTSLNRTIGNMQVSSNAIVAAITTIYLHEMEVEEQNNMMLTWKRAPLSLWKVSRILPNQEFHNTKRK